MYLLIDAITGQLLSNKVFTTPLDVIIYLDKQYSNNMYILETDIIEDHKVHYILQRCNNVNDWKLTMALKPIETYEVDRFDQSIYKTILKIDSL